jgi:hypothetical protein
VECNLFITLFIYSRKGYDGYISPCIQWQLHDAKKSFEIVFPFAMTGPTVKNPVTLPDDYQAVSSDDTDQIWIRENILSSSATYAQLCILLSF